MFFGHFCFMQQKRVVLPDSSFFVYCNPQLCLIVRCVFCWLQLFLRTAMTAVYIHHGDDQACMVDSAYVVFGKLVNTEGRFPRFVSVIGIAVYYLRTFCF